MMVVAIPQVSATYDRTILTFVLKILTLKLADSCCKFHMFFNCRSAAFTLPICAFSSSSDPSYVSVVLSRYVKVSTSSRTYPPYVIRFVLVVLNFTILHFLLCTLRSTAVETVATLVVFTYIC